MLIAKGMKEYCISSLMLVVSTVAGMILYTYYKHCARKPLPMKSVVG